MNAPVLVSRERRAGQLAALFAARPEVTAVALGGSLSTGAWDEASDIDLYVYTHAVFSIDAQLALIEQAGGATRADLGLPYWGGFDAWVDAPTGITVDGIYFDVHWAEEQVDRVMEAHRPSLGYSTCICRTVSQSRVLHDPHGWYGALQACCRRPYPEALRRNIIAHNHPVLRTIIPSYLNQVTCAVSRLDALSVNHRVASLLASYFDIVFALNRVLHPGEKRQLAFALRECTLLPAGMEADVAAVLAAAGGTSDEVVTHLDRLLDRLDAVLMAAGFDPGALYPPPRHSPGAAG